jgi:hypothetical protein
VPQSLDKNVLRLAAIEPDEFHPSLVVDSLRDDPTMDGNMSSALELVLGAIALTQTLARTIFTATAVWKAATELDNLEVWP